MYVRHVIVLPYIELILACYVNFFRKKSSLVHCFVIKTLRFHKAFSTSYELVTVERSRVKVKLDTREELKLGCQCHILPRLQLITTRLKAQLASKGDTALFTALNATH